MLDRSDAILKICIALAVLLAGSGIGFYYGIFLPSQEIRRQSEEMAERKASSEARQRGLAQRAKIAAAAQGEYDSCVGFAEMAYKQRWNQSCQTLHDADQSAFEDCADNLFSTRSGCLAKHPIRPARDCALPASMAGPLSQARDKRKTECLARLQAIETQGKEQDAQQP
jgi:hypothetical protein